MRDTTSRIQVLLRKKVIIMTIMVAAVAVCLAALLHGISKNNYNKTLLVNTLGKQRMLTQMMTKNANRLYILINTVQVDSSSDFREDINKSISQIKKGFLEQKMEFKDVLDSEHLGYMEIEGTSINFENSLQQISSYLSEIDNIWVEFEKSADIIITFNEVNDEVNSALAYINRSNEKLLELCDAVTMVVVDDAQRKTLATSILAVIMLLIGLIVIFISLFNLYRYIITPLNQLYKGISRFGIANADFDIKVPTKKELEPVLTEINDAFLKLNKLITLIENINSNSSFTEILEYIYNTFSVFIPYSYIGIALIKDDGKTLEASYGISDGTVIGLPNKLLNTKTEISETSLGKIIDNGEARIINDYEEYIQGKVVKDYTAAVIDAGLKASISLPLKVNKRPLGVIFFSSKKKNIYVKEHVEFLETLANSLAISFEKNIFEDHLLYSGILALAKLAEARDEDTGDHLDRMKSYSRLMAQLLFDDSKYKDMITHEYINDIERFSPMHDIGKVGVQDRILLKPGKLTLEEFEEMKEHTIYGENVLKAAEDNMEKSGKSIFIMGIEIAGSHHEKWNGSGYPLGLSGEQIPLSARIVAVADVFDALTSKRPYKQPFPFDKSFNIIIEGSGSHFDPEIVQIFIKNRDLIYEMYNSFKPNDLRSNVS